MWWLALAQLAKNNAQGQQNQANSLNYNMNSTPVQNNVQQSSGLGNAIGSIASIFGKENLWQK